MRFRCVNDYFSYCTAKPAPGKSRVTFLESGEQLMNLNCKLSPATCGRNISNTELARMEGVVNPTALKRGKAGVIHG